MSEENNSPAPSKPIPYASYGGMLALLILLIDQVTKIVAFDYVAQHDGIVEVTSFFNLVMVENRGISFGLFSQSKYSHIFFLITSSLITIVLFFWLRKADNYYLSNGLSLIIGGAVGNIIDRIRMGAVADFLDFHAFGYHWPAFNVADAAICIGAILLLIDAFFFAKDT